MVGVNMWLGQPYRFVGVHEVAITSAMITTMAGRKLRKLIFVCINEYYK